MKKITLTFKDDADADNFARFHGVCKETDGTPAGFRLGIGCAALKKSVLVSNKEVKPRTKKP